jgi:hypothetical protein
MGMSSYERIEAAIALRKPDRVPVVPIIDMFAARYGGITQHEMFFNIERADLSLRRTMDDLGRVDGFNLSYGGMGALLGFLIPSPPRLPGVDGVPDDAVWQFDERPIMEPPEYRDIVEHGAVRWTLAKLRETHPRMRGTAGLARELGKVISAMRNINRSEKAWRGKDVEPLVGANLVFTPMEWMSLMLRSFDGFMLDLFRCPDDIRAAGRALSGPLRTIGMAGVKLSGIRRVFMGGTRTSASCLSPRQFEELALPEWQETCEYFVARGITPLLHFDSEWTPFFPYLKNLPARRCILNLDGTSDIFKAKEVLGDHMCIMGDVPATLFKLGDPEEVGAYCERLIREVGADGGFILSSGCTVPLDAKPENVKAMIESVTKHGRY